MIFLVITADCGMRHHDLLGPGAALGDDAPHGLGDLVELLDLAVGDPALLEALDAKRSSTYSPAAVCPSSTSLTLDELMSSPIIGGMLAPNNTSRKLTSLISQRATAVRWIVKKLLQC